jgi:hypothetical protein
MTGHRLHLRCLDRARRRIHGRRDERWLDRGHAGRPDQGCCVGYRRRTLDWTSSLRRLVGVVSRTRPRRGSDMARRTDALGPPREILQRAARAFGRRSRVASFAGATRVPSSRPKTAAFFVSLVATAERRGPRRACRPHLAPDHLRRHAPRRRRRRACKLAVEVKCQDGRTGDRLCAVRCGSAEQHVEAI